MYLKQNKLSLLKPINELINHSVRYLSGRKIEQFVGGTSRLRYLWAVQVQCRLRYLLMVRFSADESVLALCPAVSRTVTSVLALLSPP